APDARVIMVTAYASIELAVDAMRLGAAHFVRKPMTPETLRGAVAAALDAGPRPSGRRAGGARAADTPIERITLNGFRIEPTPRTGSEMPNEHAFLVTRFPTARRRRSPSRSNPTRSRASRGSPVVSCRLRAPSGSGRHGASCPVTCGRRAGSRRPGG